jgi:hypothetical protein
VRSEAVSRFLRRQFVPYVREPTQRKTPQPRGCARGKVRSHSDGDNRHTGSYNAEGPPWFHEERPRRGIPRPSAALCFAPGQEGFETGSDESIPEPPIGSYAGEIGAGVHGSTSPL